MKNRFVKFSSLVKIALCASMILSCVGMNALADSSTPIFQLQNTTFDGDTQQGTTTVPGAGNSNGTISTNNNACTSSTSSGTVGDTCCIKVENPEATNSWFRCMQAETESCPVGATSDNGKCNEDCSQITSGGANTVVIRVTTNGSGSFNNYMTKTCAQLGGQQFAGQGLNCTIIGCTPGAIINAPEKVEAKASYGGANFRSWAGCEPAAGRVCSIKCPDFGDTKTVTADFHRPPAVTTTTTTTVISNPGCALNDTAVTFKEDCCSGHGCLNASGNHVCKPSNFVCPIPSVTNPSPSPTPNCGLGCCWHAWGYGVESLNYSIAENRCLCPTGYNPTDMSACQSTPTTTTTTTIPNNSCACYGGLLCSFKYTQQTCEAFNGVVDCNWGCN